MAEQTSDQPIRIVIFGVGAMGCLFGSYLTPHADVTLVGTWPEQIKLLNNRRLTIKFPNERFDRHIDLKAQSTPVGLEGADYVLILTKSTQTERAAKIANTLLNEDGLCVPIQNGIGNFEAAAEQVGEERTALGTTTMGATIEAPGVLRFGGEGVLYLATRPPVDERIRVLADLCERAGLDVITTTNIESVLWAKLVINAAINALTALLSVKNGTLVAIEDSHTQWIMREAAEEAARIAKAKKIELPYKDAGEEAAHVAYLTAENTSSMLQDVMRNTTTEIEMINGAVVRAGEELGIDTPVNLMLYNLMKAREETFNDRI